MYKPVLIPLLLALLHAKAFSADGEPHGPGTPADTGRNECQIVAVLRNGFSIDHMRHEVAGSVTRLWLCGDRDAGYVEIPSEQIEGFEQRESAVPPLPVVTAVGPKANATSNPPDNNSLNKLIARAASRHEIDPDFVASVVKAESGFNPAAISTKGAGGLMQLMPRTAAELGVTDALDAAANVEGGTRYLRQLLDQYDGDPVKALAAYNAGPQRVKQYGGVPPFRETHEFIARIISDYNRKKTLQQTDPATVSSVK